MKRKYCYKFTEYRQYKCCECGRTMHEPKPHICNGQYRKHKMKFKSEDMKIEDIEKACKLNKELKELYEIRRLQCDIGSILSSVLLLFHDNKRYDLNSLLTQETKIKILDIIFSDCEERAKQIEQEIKEL